MVKFPDRIFHDIYPSINVSEEPQINGSSYCIPVVAKSLLQESAAKA